LHSVKAFAASHPASEWAGGAQAAGRGHRGTADPRDIPYLTTSRSAYKAGEGGGGGMFRVMAFVFPSHHYA